MTTYESYTQDMLYRRAVAARVTDSARCAVHLLLPKELEENNYCLTPMTVKCRLDQLDGFPNHDDRVSFIADFMDALAKHGQYVYDTYGPEAARGYAIAYDQPVHISKWISFLSCFDDSASQFLKNEFEEALTNA